MKEVQKRTLDLLETENSFKKMVVDAVNKEKKDEKKSKCPKWDNTESIERFTTRLQLWDKITSHKGKYLYLLDSLQES